MRYPAHFFTPMKSSSRILILLSSALLLAGCASTGRIASRPAPATPSTPPLQPAPESGVEVAPYRPPQVASARPQPSRAVQALLERAADQQRAGDLVAAANTLERALRIDPNDARVWNRLAHVRLAQGRYRQAAGLAAKSNALARGDAALKADNERIIARARQ